MIKFSMFAKAMLHRLNNRHLPLVPHLSKKTKNFIYVFLACCLVFVGVAHAVDNYNTQNIIKTKQDAMKSSFNQEQWLDQAMGSNAVSALRAITGPIPDDCFDNTKKVCYGPGTGNSVGGALGLTNNMIASVSDPPASGIQYFAMMKDNFLGKPAYAQNGIGFAGLEPLLPIWRGFRNIVYLLSAIVFIVMGVMIMLRVKISPQAVITIQNALPNLITTLILVTFSYAIAGLIIDAMYLVQGIFLAVIFQATNKSLGGSLLTPDLWNVPTTFGDLNNTNMWTILYLMIKNVHLGWILIVGGILGGVIGGIVGMPTLVAAPVTGVGGAVLGAVVFALVVIIMIFSILIKFLFALIKNYITIIIHIVLAPLEIGMGAFPNSKVGFSSWIMEIIANIAVFPASFLVLLLTNVISESVASSSTLWAPGIISTASFLMPTIIALGGLFILQSLPELIPTLVFSIKPSPFGSAIGKTYKETTAIAGFTNRSILNYGSNAEAARYKEEESAVAASGGTTSMDPRSVRAHSAYDIASKVFGFKR